MLPVKQPPNGGLPRHVHSSTPLDPSSKNRWQRCYMVSLTLFASAILATLVTFAVLNFLLNGMTLPPISTQTGLLQDMQQPGLPQEGLEPTGLLQQGSMAGMAAAAATANVTAEEPAEEPVAPPPRKPPPVFVHPFDDLQHLYTLPATDTSARCQQSQICDGDHSCGPDKLGCVTSAKERQDHVRKAIAWAWEGYRKYAWGHDEVDVLTRSPHAWFNLGLTIVDSLDTLLIAGLMEEYQQARYWVANHLTFHDGSNVQFFEVNIRILGGLVSAYYLSGGDDLYLHRAEQLADRLLVAFNTSSGMPGTFVPLKDAAGRASSGIADSQTNIAEAGTISIEFTSIGRLLGRDDLFDAGMQFWYVLMSSRNFSGLYCMGIHTSRADCYDPKMTIGSAADSMYEYMLKQWVLSNYTQEVPLLLYKDAMVGVRKYLVRHVWDGTEDMSIVSEARVDTGSGFISNTNDRFEHLTCFAGGMFVLGALKDINTEVDDNDFHDVILGARIGRACYELYHQAASGLAPDSVTFRLANGRPLPNRDSPEDKVRPPGIKRHRPPRAQKSAQQPATHTISTEAQQPILDLADADSAGADKPTAAGTAEQGSNTEGQQRGRRLMSLSDSEGEGEAVAAASTGQDDQGQVNMHSHNREPHMQPAQLHLDLAVEHMREMQLRPEVGMQHSRHLQAEGDPPRSFKDGGENAATAARAVHERQAQLEQLAWQQQQEAHRDAEAQQVQLAAVQRRTEVEALKRQAIQRHAAQMNAARLQAAQNQGVGSDGMPAAQAPADNAGTVAALASPPPPPSPPPPNPPPPPPPAGPAKTSWAQSTAADFLRPETIETLFYLWRATGDEIYREWGWNMFRAFERWTRLESGGYATIKNVNSVPPELANKMESFYLAETLKYFYLLFEDDPTVFSLDEWVFNTEAHPIPIWGTAADRQAMERLKQRRYAALVEQRQRAVEEAALRELEEVKRQGEALAARGPQLGRPHEREGYGLGGLEMY